MSPHPQRITQLKDFESLDSMEGLAELQIKPLPHLFRLLPKGRFLYSVYPGVLVALTIGLAASWLSQHYGAPVMLFALLLGMAFHFLHTDSRCYAGIEFCSRTILRIGVALLGLRITAAQIVGLGIWPVLTILVGVATTVLLGTVLAKRLGQKTTFGVLSAGAVAVCGASAALAISTALPRHRDLERDTILTVVAVTTLSTLVMILYPILVAAIGLDNVRAGIFLGGTIHDVAQVVGAGYMISPQTGDIATYVKLLRVATLLPVVLAVSLVVARSGGAEAAKKTPLLPMFLVGFAALVALNSTVSLPVEVIDGATTVSRWFLVTAIAALGMKTSFQDLMAVGWRPIALIVIETLWIGVLVLISTLLLM